jgi:hypothetical protein
LVKKYSLVADYNSIFESEGENGLESVFQYNTQMWKVLDLVVFNVVKEM